MMLTKMRRGIGVKKGIRPLDVPRREAQALNRLYKKTNGRKWTNSEGWTKDRTVGNWFGVTVESGHVTELRLPENNIRGKVDHHLFNDKLKHLKELRIEGNQLQGFETRKIRARTHEKSLAERLFEPVTTAVKRVRQRIGL